MACKCCKAYATTASCYGGPTKSNYDRMIKVDQEYFIPVLC